MSNVEAFKARLDRWTRSVALVGLTGLLFLAFFIILDVLMRWVFNAPFDSVADISQLAMPVVVAATFPVSVLYRQHVTIRFLGKALGPRAAAWLETVGTTLLLFFLILIAWQFTVYTAELKAGNDVTWVVELSLWPWWMVTTMLVLVAIPLQTLNAVIQFIRAASGEIGYEADDETPDFLAVMGDQTPPDEARR